MIREIHLMRLFRALVCLTFLGRAWQHLRWDAPFRGLLWKQGWLEPIVTGLFNIPWREWVSDPAVDTGIQTTIRLFGVFYVICAVVTLIVRKDQKWAHWLLGAGSVALCFLGFLYFLEKGFRIGQWVEYSLQFGSPLMLVFSIKGGLNQPRLQLAIKIAIALTFIGHGLYAAGIYPMPGHFVTMLMNGLGVGENAARGLLVWAGYLDFVAATALFIPKLEKPALYYMVFWGFVTAAARLVSYYDGTNIIGWLDGWLYQCIYRLVHGGIPLILLLALRPKAQSEAVQPTPVTGLAPIS